MSSKRKVPVNSWVIVDYDRDRIAEEWAKAYEEYVAWIRRGGPEVEHLIPTPEEFKILKGGE